MYVSKSKIDSSSDFLPERVPRCPLISQPKQYYARVAPRRSERSLTVAPT